MKGTNRFKLLSIILVFAYLLSACSGAQGTPGGGGKPESKEVAFTGAVESVGSGQITVSGQVVVLDAKSMVDPNIQVGDIVKVEAQVSADGAVIAIKVESFGADDTNTNSGNDTGANTNDDNSNANTNDDNSNTDADDSNTNTDDNNNGTGGTEQEITGVVSAISASSVTVDGVEYKFDGSTEFNDPIFAGDTVKLHVIVGADGSLTVREIEKISGTTIGDDNANGNDNDDNSNDDDSNDDNSNDDDDNNDNSNDDDDNDDNSNDDDDNDDNSNSGSNSNGG